ncbi:hypothetical protein AMAG_17673 [Allomyces macrogynus ATCC 38327]|uniref:Ubiquitin-like domain-containing protein n=1 Tax=Allomyces macrogynus (strain ATCC 38327) TaxID=578462 RepID=A0A0L0RWQ9_ALLM3|nr:hypothetical protein AMAG_17673 [Allomyces macrogynus ATCC 38327]|eukprot:KNE54471.1 hypothetical protein AMAG_17673 [Allomyces macrogynus ATCC 38327]
MDDHKPDVKPGNVQQISIRLRDQQNNEIEIKARSTTKFQKIAKAYANKKGIDLNYLRFNLDGERVKLEDSIGELDLLDGDVVDVNTDMIGGVHVVIDDAQKGTTRARWSCHECFWNTTHCWYIKP